MSGRASGSVASGLSALRPGGARAWRTPAERHAGARRHAAGTRKIAAAAALVALSSIAWLGLDPHAGAREGNRLFAAGKYGEAAQRYNQALVDNPGSPLLHFNLGDAHYKQGQYAEALESFQRAPAGDADPGHAARLAYNVGNTKYRMAAAAEATDPKAAVGYYAEALAAYRRAIGAAPQDLDAKFNYEFVEKALADLEKKLEEKKRQEEEQQQQQQDQQQEQESQADEQEREGEQQQAETQDRPEEEEEQDRPEQDEQAAERREEQDQDGQQPGEQQEQQEQQAETQPDERQEHGQGEEPPAGEQQQAAGAGGEDAAGESGEMSRREAVSLLDSQRDQEVRPEEILRNLQTGVVAEPLEDW